MSVHSSSAAGGHADPAARGFLPIYREASRNHCPGCGQTQWLIGRIMAQCAFCETALPLEHSFRVSTLSPG